MANSHNEGTQDGLYAANHEQLVRQEYAHATTSQSYGLLGRWSVYQYATEPFDYYNVALAELPSHKDANLVDIGSSDGMHLVRKRIHDNHTGHLVGVDIDPVIFKFGAFLNSQLNTSLFKPVSFVSAHAERLPFKTNTFDGASALFMLYHVAQPRAALSEIQRTLKPEGRLVVATSSPDNKQRHRVFERLIAEELRLDAPPSFTQHFDTRTAESVLPDFFSIAKIIRQRCKLRVLPANQDESASLDAYMESLDSMRKHFYPAPTLNRWRRALGKVVYPTIAKEFAEVGYFDDTIDRALYVCVNKK